MNRTKYPIASASFHRSEQCRPCLPAGKRMMWNFASRRGLFPRHVFLYERATSCQIAEFRFSRRSHHHIWLHQKMSMWWPKTTTTRPFSGGLRTRLYAPDGRISKTTRPWDPTPSTRTATILLILDQRSWLIWKQPVSVDDAYQWKKEP